MTDLVKYTQTYQLSTQYQNLLERINDYYPMIEKSTKNFYKTQSQFMDNMLTVHQPTELRSLRQILAEINKSKMALDEAYFGLRKKRVEIKKREFQLTQHCDVFERETLEIEVEELQTQIASTMNYVEGAIRRVSAFITQYNNILRKYGKDEFTEEDFERDECRYHVMKAFEQALCAARSRNGSIDEGNQIYFYQIGISGSAAQCEVNTIFDKELEYLKRNEFPPHKIISDWLEEMGDKYSSASIEFAKRKGMTLFDTESLLIDQH